MINKFELQYLGYTKKQDLHNKSQDFRYGEEGDRNYLVNLNIDGAITVVFPINSNRKELNFTDLEDFTEWHNTQQ